MSVHTSTQEPLAPRTIAARGAAAVALSALGNAVLLFVVLETDLVAPFMALSYPPVLFLSVAGGVGATAVYWLLTRRVADPDAAFLRVASVALVASFVPDLAILVFDQSATLGAVVVLMMMHVVSAAACVGALTRLLR